MEACGASARFFVMAGGQVVHLLGQCVVLVPIVPSPVWFFPPPDLLWRHAHIWLRVFAPSTGHAGYIWA